MSDGKRKNPGRRPSAGRDDASSEAAGETAAAGDLAALIEHKRLVIVVGEGGVGKTSCAAAVALAAARRGKRAAVLTVDPAPRLGTALGFSSIDERPQRVDVPHAERRGGSLDAFRLDTRRTFDRVVERLAPSPRAAEAIMQNPIYRALAGSVGGSESYMALQRLYELRDQGTYELLVVDTPPAIHAEDLLSAPARLAALIDTDAAKVLANPAIVLARAGSRLAKAGAAMVLPLVERLTGLSLRKQVVDFIINFEAVLWGLSERAREIEAWLASPEASFVIVTRATAGGVAAAIELKRSLGARKLGVDAVIVNRLSPELTAQRDRSVDLADAPPGTAAALARIEQAMASLRARERAALARLREILAGEHGALGVEARAPGENALDETADSNSNATKTPGDDTTRTVVVTLESLEHDVGGVADLIVLGESLFEPRSGGANTGG